MRDALAPCEEVARTLADMERDEGTEARHAAEAIQYRALDRGA